MQRKKFLLIYTRRNDNQILDLVGIWICNDWLHTLLGNVHVWNLSSEWHQSILHEKDASIQSVDIDAAGNMIAAVTNKGTCYMSTFPIRYVTKLKENQYVSFHGTALWQLNTLFTGPAVRISTWCRPEQSISPILFAPTRKSYIDYAQKRLQHTLWLFFAHQFFLSD